MMAAVLEGEAVQIARKTVDLAKEGKPWAARMCFSYLMPRGTDRTVQFDLPPIQNLDDVSLGMQSVMTAVKEGDLTPQQGETIFRILGRHADVMVYQDLQRRVEKLERGPAANENKVEIIKTYK